MPDFQAYAESIAEDYLSFRGHDRAYITRMEFCGDSIDIYFEESYCSCCHPDSDSLPMPTSYLWDEDWRKQEQAYQFERLKEAQAKKAREEQARLEAKTKRELAQLAELKAKYEGE